ncbi:MAG TPA: hypothetical protein PLT36_00900 [Erysipelotrichaceae bacterium]|nr:hypothetical protein [Erysipelotrichaceae bacterium]HQA84909.1 hypothetical protein [Erysipelotrichaceae bacterium]
MRKKIFVALSILLVLIGCSSKNFEPLVSQVVEVIELNSTEDPLTFLKDVEEIGLEFTIVSSDLDVTKAGVYTIVYRISQGRKNVERSYTIKVRDYDGPVITIEDSIDILYGGLFILKDVATAYDETDGDVSASLHYQGSIDAYTIGSYKIVVSATDQFDNVTTKEVVVNVKNDEKASYKKTICGTYKDISYLTGQAPTLTLNEDGTFELYLNSCSVVNLVTGSYQQYQDTLYLVSNDYRFSVIDEENLVRFIIQIDGTLLFDSQLDVCAPNYGDVFSKEVKNGLNQ